MNDADRPVERGKTELPPMLGDKVRDRITGFTGIAYGIVNWMTGNQQMYVVPALDANGNLGVTILFDVERLEVVERGVVVIPSNVRVTK